MTLYDALMAGVVVAGMVWGAWRGITWQLASIASLVLGYAVAHPLSDQLAPQFPGDPAVARGLALMVVYAAVSGGVFLAAWTVRATLRRMQFEAFDRHLGMLLGGLEGALLGLIVTLFVVSLAPQTRGPIFASPAGHVVGQVMDTLGPVLPSEARTVLAPFWNNADPVASDADRATEPERPVRPEPRAVAADRDPGVTPAGNPEDAPSLQGLIQAGEERVGRAIADAAKKGLEQAGTPDGRTIERR